MGVAGCGKSSLGAALARAEGLPLVEGDDHHSAGSRAKMSQGIALTDADRDGWLDILGQQLQAHPQGLVLTCSALKRSYRDRLRKARARAALRLPGHRPGRCPGPRGGALGDAFLLHQPGGQPVRHAGVARRRARRAAGRCAPPAGAIAGAGVRLAEQQGVRMKQSNLLHRAQSAHPRRDGAGSGRDGAGGVRQRGAALRLRQRRGGERGAVAPAVRVDGVHGRHRRLPGWRAHGLHQPGRRAAEPAAAFFPRSRC